jgi:hypothetical protein
MDIFKLKRNHDYFYQIRGQLHVTQRQYCYFILYFGRRKATIGWDQTPPHSIIC